MSHSLTHVVGWSSALWGAIKWSTRFSPLLLQLTLLPDELRNVRNVRSVRSARSAVKITPIEWYRESLDPARRNRGGKGRDGQMASMILVRFLSFLL